MAKETRAQREQREAESHAAYWAEFKENYSRRFIAVLFAYTELHPVFVVSKVDDDNYAFSKNERYSSVNVMNIVAPADYDQDVIYALESVERELTNYAAEVAEETRKYTVKMAALGKLSPEEKELLGL